MIPAIDPVEARVLGSLLEKSITTPEYYPLTLNALVNACNQKSNRDPVMTLDDETVRNAGGALGTKGLVAFLRDSRSTKYEHRLSEVLNLGRREEAILCELLIRGPQTPGELRTRCARLHPMEELADVQSALQRMTDRDAPLVCALPRQPGTKELRFSHLLSGAPDASLHASSATHPPPARSSQAEETGGRLAALESQIASLQQQIDSLNQKLNSLLG